MTCKRCGQFEERHDAKETRCNRCRLEVAAIIAADAKRRAPRFSSPKDLTGQTGPL